MSGKFLKSKYLIEIEHAEHALLSHFHDYILFFSEFLGSCGISPGYAWYLIELPTERLVSGVKGEVDILSGNLEFTDPLRFNAILNDYKRKMPDAHPHRHYSFAAMTLALDGGLRWPPKLDHIVGIEVKSSYLPPTASEISFDEIKSTKKSKDDLRRIRISVSKLLRMGFTKVGLFELLATPPADGIGNQPWFHASHVAGKTLDVMNDLFSKRLPDDSPVGHGVLSICGINGIEEVASGSMSCRILRYAKDNHLLRDPAIRDNRIELEENLSNILGDLRPPSGMPAVFIYDKTSKRISYANEGWIQC